MKNTLETLMMPIIPNRLQADLYPQSLNSHEIRFFSQHASYSICTGIWYDRELSAQWNMSQAAIMTLPSVTSWWRDNQSQLCFTSLGVKPKSTSRSFNDSGISPLGIKKILIPHISCECSPNWATRALVPSLFLCLLINKAELNKTDPNQQKDFPMDVVFQGT